MVWKSQLLISTQNFPLLLVGSSLSSANGLVFTPDLSRLGAAMVVGFCTESFFNAGDKITSFLSFFLLFSFLFFLILKEAL